MLLENHPSFHDVLIIGFGINLNIGIEEFPPDVRATATSVLIETGRKYSLSALLRTLLRHYDALVSADRDKVHEQYCQQLYGRGQTISINGYTGIFSSVAPDGQLELLVNGTMRHMNSGSPLFPEQAQYVGGVMP
jgi:BirA family biotin operon repressor/biotin-[acetyl-CoA-carboxylase] ligase